MLDALKQDKLLKILLLFSILFIGFTSSLFPYPTLETVLGLIIILCVIKISTKLKYWTFITVTLIIGLPYQIVLKTRLIGGNYPFNVIDILMIFVLIELVVYLKREKLILVNKNIMILISMFLFYGLFLGVLNSNPIEYIVREERYFIYFFIISFSIGARLKSGNFYLLRSSVIIGALIASMFQLFYATKGINNSGFDLTRNISVMTPAIPLGMLFVLLNRSYSKSVLSFNKILTNSVLLIFIVAVIASMTRSVWLQSLISLFIILIFYKKERKKIVSNLLGMFVYLLPFLIVLFLMYPNHILDLIENVKDRYLSSLNQNNGNTINFRLQDSISLLKLLIEKKIWIFGTGFGSQLTINMIGYTGVLTPTLTDYTENSYLYYVWKTGLFGFLLFVIYIVLSIKNNFMNIKNPINDEYKIYSIMCLLTIIASVFTIAFSGNLAPQQMLLGLGIVFGANFKFKNER